jgi:hypothetical protein
MDGWNLLSSASLEAEVTANIFYFAEGPMLVGNIKLFVFFFFFIFYCCEQSWLLHNSIFMGD